MFGALIITLSEIKMCGVVPSFCIKMIESRTLQACSFKHRIKESMSSVVGKLIYLDRAGGSSSSPTWATRLMGELLLHEKFISFTFWCTRNSFDRQV